MGNRMSHGQNLQQTVAILGEPFTVVGVRNALARGEFRGLGYKVHGQWFTTDEDRAKMIQRLRDRTHNVHNLDRDVTPQIPASGPAGFSARSRQCAS